MGWTIRNSVTSRPFQPSGSTSFSLLRLSFRPVWLESPPPCCLLPFRLCTKLGWEIPRDLIPLFLATSIICRFRTLLSSPLELLLSLLPSSEISSSELEDSSEGVSTYMRGGGCCLEEEEAAVSCGSAFALYVSEERISLSIVLRKHFLPQGSLLIGVSLRR